MFISHRTLLQLTRSLWLPTSKTHLRSSALCSLCNSAQNPYLSLPTYLIAYIGMDGIFGNASTSPPARWKAEPYERGTFGILSTCIITLGLCVWTAIHLNVPARNGHLRQLLRKVGWMVLGFLAPELVIVLLFPFHSAVLQFCLESLLSAIPLGCLYRFSAVRRCLEAYQKHCREARIPTRGLSRRRIRGERAGNQRRGMGALAPVSQRTVPRC